MKARLAPLLPWRRSLFWAVLLLTACSGPDSSPVGSSPPAPPPPPPPPLPAFPGAEGWGATALTESRSLPVRIHRVTTTASSGEGSLSVILEATSSHVYDVIVFAVGGRISAPPEGFRLNASHVYIAGQTAPGNGIVIDGDGTAFWIRGPAPNVTDIVIRYLRFRGRAGHTNNHLIVAKGGRIVLDHISMSWADNYLLALLRYGGMGWSFPIFDVSIQHSLLAEAFATHPTAFVLGSNELLKTHPRLDLRNVSIHRNLLAHNSHRNPMSAADNVVIANNTIYNWRQGVIQLEHRGVADIVNNYAVAGPQTREIFQYVVNPDCAQVHPTNPYSIFASGNVGPQSADASGDNWTGLTRQVACYFRSGAEEGQAAPGEWRRDEPQEWETMAFPPRLRPASESHDLLVHDVGANARLDCEGNWIPAIDGVDSRILSDLMTGSGPALPPVDEGSAGGWPFYAAGIPCPDTDRDGLPDAWEERYFGCATCANATAVASRGYLVIEHFLNGTAP